MGTINKPNLVLPLASSYNERTTAGLSTILAGKDQRKVNAAYEITKNSVTGGGKFDLIKRPGVIRAAPQYGVSAQTAYLITTPPFGFTADAWVFSINGNDLNVSDETSTKAVFSSGAGFIPRFIDRTLLSGVDTLVAEYRGSGNTRVFYTGISASIGAAWSEITDADFTVNAAFMVGKMEHMDGYAFQMLSNNKIINSDLNSISNWTSTSFVTKQIQQDEAVGLAKLNNQILAFGQETMEVFYNAGNASGSPLSPIRHLFHKVGLVLSTSGTHYYCTVKNKIYFVGKQTKNIFSKAFYSYDGSTISRLSNAYIDKILDEITLVSIYSLSFPGQTAIAICRTLPSSTSQAWLMYFPDLNEWFEWESANFQPTNNGTFFLGSFTHAGSIFQFSNSGTIYQDDGTSYQYLTQFALPNSGPYLKRMSTFGVEGDTGTSGGGNTLLVEFSDDDYQTFKTAGTISLSSDNKTLKRGGAYRNRAVRLSNTNAAETRLQSFIALVK